MKINSKLLVLTAVATAAITWYLLKKKSATKMLQDISDEGYETASDILFPGKQVGEKLHYGPVIPQY